MANRPRQGGDAPASGEGDLRRTIVALVAGWVVPGLGHILLGRIARGAFFATIVFTAFGLGLAHDGRLALRDDRQPILSALQVVANLGVGPADTVARWAVYGEAAYRLPRDSSHPTHTQRVRLMRERARSSVSLYGTAYLWTAGLMNLMLLFDVWDLGTGRKK